MEKNHKVLKVVAAVEVDVEKDTPHTVTTYDAVCTNTKTASYLFYDHISSSILSLFREYDEKNTANTV